MRTQKYHQAAIAYLIYGILYLAGALYVASVGAGGRAMSLSSGAIWFILGALVVIAFPIFIWKGYKWFTRILAVLVLFRMIGLIRIILNDSGEGIPLPWGAALPMRYGALVALLIAGAACFMLFRAGWDLRLREG